MEQNLTRIHSRYLFWQVTEKTVHREEELLTLIRQGAEQYFSGQKSLDEAAALIQSRAAIYVAEKG